MIDSKPFIFIYVPYLQNYSWRNYQLNLQQILKKILNLKNEIYKYIYIYIYKYLKDFCAI